MDATDQPETVLLIDAAGKLMSVSTSAFRISSGPKRRIERLFNQSTIIYRSGTVKKINRIEFLGYWGQSLRRKLLSIANGGVRRVMLELVSEPKVTLADIKQIVRKELPEDRKSAEPNFRSASSLPDLLRKVDEANSCAEIFEIIGVPSPENALDVLC